MTRAGFAATRFAAPDSRFERHADGSILIESNIPLRPCARQIGVWLRRWAREAPERAFLAERSADGSWRTLGYAAALVEIDRLSQALIDRGLGPARPLVVLSEKSIRHCLLGLAAMQIGIPYVPISPAYSLIEGARHRLRTAIDLVNPGLIYVETGRDVAAALADIARPDCAIVTGEASPPAGLTATPYATLAATPAGPAVPDAFARVGPDDVAKILFTSGTTGDPKAVPNTHRMLCSNQEALAQLFPFYEDAPPVVCDWQPWHHAGGANYNFNMVLRHGGTYYIDHGKPTPEAIGVTLANLRQVSPTAHFNVPRGYAMLIEAFERDAALRDTFFRRLDVIVYSAASLPPELWARIEALSVAALGVKVPMISAWGMTELAPLHTTCHWPIDRAGLIGVPVPGSQVKLVPTAEGRFEIRCKGPNVMAGYLARPELNAAAFDEEGFFRTGDAARLLDPNDANQGLVFDGRLVDDFKLTTGNWVQASEVRAAALAAIGPLAQDAIVVGEGRDDLGLLVFPDRGSLAELSDGDIRGRLARALAGYNATTAASSRRIARAMVLAEPPSLAHGEITDKGTLNRRAVVGRREALLNLLYSSKIDSRVIRLAPENARNEHKETIDG